MAYLPGDQDQQVLQDQEKEQDQAPMVATGEGAFVGGEAGVKPQQHAEQAPVKDIRKYVEAHKGGDLAGRISGELGKRQEKVQTGLQKAQTGFQEKTGTELQRIQKGQELIREGLFRDTGKAAAFAGTGQQQVQQMQDFQQAGQAPSYIQQRITDPAKQQEFQDDYQEIIGLAQKQFPIETDAASYDERLRQLSETQRQLRELYGKYDVEVDPYQERYFRPILGYDQFQQAKPQTFEDFFVGRPKQLIQEDPKFRTGVEDKVNIISDTGPVDPETQEVIPEEERFDIAGRRYYELTPEERAKYSQQQAADYYTELDKRRAENEAALAAQAESQAFLERYAPQYGETAEERVAQFEKLRRGEAQGYDIEELPELQAQARQLSELAKLGKDESGRFELLRQLAQSPDYTKGQQRLDQLLLQTDPEQAKIMRQLEQQRSKPVQQQIESVKRFEQARDVLVKQQAQKAKTNIYQDLFGTEDKEVGEIGTVVKEGSALGEFEKALNDKFEDFTAEGGELDQAREAMRQKLMAGENLTRDELSYMGIDDQEEQNKFLYYYDQARDKTLETKIKEYVEPGPWGNIPLNEMFSEEEFEVMGNKLGQETQTDPLDKDMVKWMLEDKYVLEKPAFLNAAKRRAQELANEAFREGDLERTYGDERAEQIREAFDSIPPAYRQQQMYRLKFNEIMNKVQKGFEKYYGYDWYQQQRESGQGALTQPIDVLKDDSRWSGPYQLPTHLELSPTVQALYETTKGYEGGGALGARLGERSKAIGQSFDTLGPVTKKQVASPEEYAKYVALAKLGGFEAEAGMRGTEEAGSALSDLGVLTTSRLKALAGEQPSYDEAGEVAREAAIQRTTQEQELLDRVLGPKWQYRDPHTDVQLDREYLVPELRKFVK